MRTSRVVLPWVAAFVLSLSGVSAGQANLVDNPSFETLQDKAAPVKDAYSADYKDSGVAFTGWQGTLYEGRCEFRVGRVAHSGNTSALLVGILSPKMRLFQVHDLEPGRYRITAYLRGLDIGKGTWNVTTEFMFDEQVHPAREERHLRLDEADLRRARSRRRRRSSVRRSACGPGLLLGRRRDAGEGRRRRGADAEAGARTRRRRRSRRRASSAPAPSAAPSAATATCPRGRRCYACGTALDGEEGRVRRAAGQADHVVRGRESRSSRRRQAGRSSRSTPPTARRRCGSTRATAAWTASRTGRATTTSRPTSTPTPPTRWSCTSRSATRARPTTGPA